MGGRPSHWADPGVEGQVIGSDTERIPSQIAVLEGDRITWIRVDDGSTNTMTVGNFQIPFDKPPVAWPTQITRGVWQLRSEDAYLRVLDRVRMGGLDDATLITDEGVGEAQEKRIEQIVGNSGLPM
jgi:hypothetical protein